MSEDEQDFVVRIFDHRKLGVMIQKSTSHRKERDQLEEKLSKKKNQ